MSTPKLVAALPTANRCLSYVNLEEYRRTIEDLNEAICLNPQDSFGYGPRGNAYGYLGSLTIEDLKEAIHRFQSI